MQEVHPHKASHGSSAWNSAKWSIHHPKQESKKGTLTSKHRLGRPPQSTLQDGRQLLRWVRNGHNVCKCPPPPRVECQQHTNVPLIPTADQEPIGSRLQAEHYEGRPWRKPLSAGS